MSMQVTELFRRGVVRPLNSEARDQLLTFFMSRIVRCEWLPIPDDAYFTSLWDSGIFQAIGNACDLVFSEYEEFVVQVEQVAIAQKAIGEYTRSKTSDVRQFATCLQELFKDASTTGMPVIFLL